MFRIHIAPLFLLIPILLCANIIADYFYLDDVIYLRVILQFMQCTAGCVCFTCRVIVSRNIECSRGRIMGTNVFDFLIIDAGDLTVFDTFKYSKHKWHNIHNN